MGDSGEFAAVFVGRKTPWVRFAGTVDSQRSEISLHWETTVAINTVVADPSKSGNSGWEIRRNARLGFTGLSVHELDQKFKF